MLAAWPREPLASGHPAPEAASGKRSGETAPVAVVPGETSSARRSSKSRGDGGAREPGDQRPRAYVAPSPGSSRQRQRSTRSGSHLVSEMGSGLPRLVCGRCAWRIHGFFFSESRFDVDRCRRHARALLLSAAGEMLAQSLAPAACPPLRYHHHRLYTERKWGEKLHPLPTNHYRIRLSRNFSAGREQVERHHKDAMVSETATRLRKNCRSRRKLLWRATSR